MTDTKHLDELTILEIRRRAENGEFDWENIPVFIPTSVNNLGIGLHFIMDFSVDAPVAFDLEVSVVQEKDGARYRASLGDIPREYEVLAAYAAIGQSAMRFKQNFTTWGEFKLAIATFSGVEIP